jgi:ComF family protein
MHRWLRFALDALFPADCGACDRPLPAGAAAALCASCLAAMRPLSGPVCTRCGVPVVDGARLCPPCTRREPCFATARAAGLYLTAARPGADPLAVCVQRLKYAGRRDLAPVLGALLAERYPFGQAVLLVPVPLHRSRLRARGFNQAALLAQELARRRGLPVALRALVRRRQTRAQPGLDSTARRRNLADAFEVRLPARVVGRSIVLVDDVLTTGATADACATALLRAGVARVDVYTVGRAP